MLWYSLEAPHPQYMMHNAQKSPLYNLQTTQALISLCLSTGWSGPLLSAYRISGHCSICRWTENTQIRLHRWAWWSRPMLSAKYVRAIFVRWAFYVFMEKLCCIFLQSNKKHIYQGPVVQNLMKLLANLMLKFLSWIFAKKNVSSFWKKNTHFFVAKISMYLKIF